MADYEVKTLSRDNFPYEKTISLDPSRKKRKMSVTIANAAERVLSPGTLIQKIPVNTFEGSVGTGGIDAAVTTIPLTGNSGVLVDGSVIRINDEFIIVGTYDDVANEITGCTRGAWGSTAASHAENDTISVKDIGATATQTYKPWDGLQPIEGYVNENVDASSTDQGAYMIFDDEVDRSLMSADNADIPIPEGLDKNSMLNFVEVE